MIYIPISEGDIYL